MYQLHLFEAEFGVRPTTPEELIELEKEVSVEESKRSTLVTEIDHLRTDCALLRAKIEIATQAGMTSTRF